MASTFTSQPVSSPSGTSRKSLHSIASSIDRMGGQATQFINRYPVRAFALLSLAYLLIVAALSSTKLLWLDELITLHIAQSGSPAGIWHALVRGADPNPPLTHLAVLACLRVFGDHAFALRLPAYSGTGLVFCRSSCF